MACSERGWMNTTRTEWKCRTNWMRCAPKILGDADLLEDRIGDEIATRHKDYEEQIFGLIEKLNKGGG